MHEICDQILECCGVRFQSKSSFRSHTYVCHKDGYSCAICGRRFCRKALLKRHQSIHNGRKDFVCSDCGYSTSHKSNLERHKKIHLKSSKTISVSDGMLPLKKRKYLTNYTDISTKKKMKGPRRSNIGKKLISNTQQFQDKDVPFHFTWPMITSNHGYEPYFKCVNNALMDNIPMDPSKIDGFRRYDAHHYANTTYSGPKLSPSVCESLESTSSLTCSTPSDSDHFHTRIMTRPRLCASPYKCSNCCELFSSQVQLAYHTQYLHPHNDIVTLSIVNVMKKMKKIEGNIDIKNEHLVRKDELQRFLLKNTNENV